MAVPYAEVIGDPVAQSKSPIIHRHWLAELGIAADYRASRVAAGDLAAFLEQRRGDPDWRGCNVTIPHKQSVMALVDQVDPAARAIGAVNCVVPRGAGLSGFNTDIDGVAAALGATALEGRTAVVIGGGGGARAAVASLARRDCARIVLAVRDPAKAGALAGLAPRCAVEQLSPERIDALLESAALVVNASPLGMRGAPDMPAWLIAGVGRQALGATLFDMVTTPAETTFLAAGRAKGGVVVDGLTMLIGQARGAFELLFGCPAPSDDPPRGLLAT